MSQRSKEKEANKRMQSSACAKHLEFARLKESGKEWCFPLNVDKKMVQFPITSLPRAKHCEKTTSRKFQEVKVYKSFLEEEDAEEEESRLTSSGTIKTSLAGKTTTTSDIKKRLVKVEEGTLASRCKQSNAAVRRYALYRGMLNHSRFEEDHKIKKKIGRVSYDRKKQMEDMTSTETSKHQSRKDVSYSAHNTSSVSNVPETIAFRSRSDVFVKSQFPKRIYIREIANGAIVDEIVDIRNEREWEVLNYMAPLRHISSKPGETLYSLRFEDVRNFDVYYYPYPWR